MSSNEKSAESLEKIVKTLRLKHVAMFILAVAAVAWVIVMLGLLGQNDELIAKNEKLVDLTSKLERHNERLDERLQCRARLTDKLNRAIGLGLVAVAQDNSVELERQALIIVELVQQEDCT